MKIDKLIIQNFRGIQHLELDFNKQINVIYGVNGAGKSSVLDAISIMLSWVINRIKHKRASGKQIVEKDINNSASFSSLEVFSDDINWKMVKNKKGHGASSEKSDYSLLNQYTSILNLKIAAQNHQSSLPIFIYYPINRAVIDIPLRIRKKHNFKILSTYDNALDSGADFRTFFEWFREREDLENEINAERNNTKKYNDPHLMIVKKAWELFLPEFKNFRVRRNPLRLEVLKNNKLLTVNQLSDGEKVLLSMIGDLARRLAIANPDSEDILNSCGIVLIDEIDLHLHPKWQRMIVEKLPSVFPGCQFILTTHSPHVITHTKAEDLFRLTQVDMEVILQKPNESYGKNVDRILEDLMGLETTRPSIIQEGLTEIFTLINNNNFSTARVKIGKLKLEIGEDPDLVRAEVLIKRKEIIGK